MLSVKTKVHHMGYSRYKINNKYQINNNNNTRHSMDVDLDRRLPSKLRTNMGEL